MLIATRTCPYCKKEKPISEFGKNSLRKNGHNYECLICGKARRKEYHLKNKKSQNEKDKKRREEFQKRTGVNRNTATRIKVISAYGGRCFCCGEDRYEFLALDHVNGGGSSHIHSGGTQIHYWDAIRRGYPRDYRILCHNCNFAIGHYGYCPHTHEGIDIVKIMEKL